MSLTAEQRLAILEHAWETFPHEACGVVAGGQVHRVKNVASDPEHEFSMDHQELLAIYENYGALEGVYHSHPRGRPNPSAADREHAPYDVPYYIATMGDVYEFLFRSDH